MEVQGCIAVPFHLESLIMARDCISAGHGAVRSGGHMMSSLCLQMERVGSVGSVSTLKSPLPDAAVGDDENMPPAARSGRPKEQVGSACVQMV